MNQHSNPSEKYIIYLRKSRADRDAELHGEGETLARHEKLLTEYAAKHHLCVEKIYREVVSGETIAARPEVQKLLNDVGTGEYAGVLVVEIERLARGDTMDQGYISAVFKASETKIITPIKTYDPCNEFDEEYFEFGLFMSRREYKTINRRIQRGRIASVNEGKYIASTAPLGYERVKLKADKGWTLKIIDKEAATVRLIFDLYVNGRQLPDGSRQQMGMSLIARELDMLGIKSRSGRAWSRSSIKDILCNHTYIGKVRWQWKKTYKEAHNGAFKEHRTKDGSYMLADGLHPAIIDEETFEKAQQIMKSSKHISTPGSRELMNPLSGLVYCKKCGSLMTRTFSNTKAAYYVLKCPNRYCDNISAPISLIEDKILSALQEYISLAEASMQNENAMPNLAGELEAKKELLSGLSSELATLKKQLDKAYTLLEQDVYTTDIFIERSSKLQKSIAAVEQSIEKVSKEYTLLLSEQNQYNNFVPEAKHLIDIYHSLNTAGDKNTILKMVLSRVEYLKLEKNTKGKGSTANFEITISPKLQGFQ